MNERLPPESGAPVRAKTLRRRVTTTAADRTSIVDAIAPLRRRWSAHEQLRPVTAAAMRGIRAKAARLGRDHDEIVERCGAAVADVTRAIAVTRDATGTRPLFILAGPNRESADGLAAALALADGTRRVVVALCSTKARPDDASAARAWDRLESAPLLERYRIPNMRESAHFRAGLEEVAVIVDALGGALPSAGARTPLVAAIDLILRARASGVPCVAVGGPIGLDQESGARRRTAPGADVTVLFHRRLTTQQSPGAKRLLGESLVASIGIPDEADPLAT